jgi:tryptophanyl-tRNA synthetase
MRPSGKLHLGHYIGVLANWKKLQEENDCFFFAADWHALTTDTTIPGSSEKASTT